MHIMTDQDRDQYQEQDQEQNRRGTVNKFVEMLSTLRRKKSNKVEPILVDDKF